MCEIPTEIGLASLLLLNQLAFDSIDLDTVKSWDAHSLLGLLLRRLITLLPVYIPSNR